MSKVTAQGYLVIKPTYSWSDSSKVVGAKIDRLRTDKPTLNRGEVAVRVRLNFDQQALQDAIPVIEMDVTSFIVPSEPEIVASVDAGIDA